MTRNLLILAATATLAACGPITVTSDPDTYSVRQQTAALKATQITLANGYPAETKVIIRPGLEVDLRQVTDSAIKVMSRHLVKNGTAVEPQAPKTVTVKVSSVRAEPHGFFAGDLAVRVRLEAQFGDGTKAEVSSENHSPVGVGRVLDGALLFAVTSLLNDDRFAGYVNR